MNGSSHVCSSPNVHFPEQAFLFLCDKEGGLAAGSGKHASAFYHLFFVFVPWLLSWAWQQLCAATFRGRIMLSAYNPGQKCRGMGAVSPGRPILPQTHKQPRTCLCCLNWKAKICPGTFESQIPCVGNEEMGLLCLTLLSVCPFTHLLWVQRESAAKDGWWLVVTPSWFKSMNWYLELQSQRLNQADCAKHQVSDTCHDHLTTASRVFMFYVPCAWMLYFFSLSIFHWFKKTSSPCVA